MLKKISLSSVIVVSFFYVFSVSANTVDKILMAKEAPTGVVFEIIGASGSLGVTLSDVKHNIEQLRNKYPDLPIAIVSHGAEQFDLMSKNTNKESQAHSMVKQLVDANSVDVHVCGTHAEWRGITPEDFPDYVDVSATGPAQINDYLAIGYELIVMP